MPRCLRITPADNVFHVLNRAHDRRTLFSTPEDYRRFAIEIDDAAQEVGMRILGYCLMPNHWHLVLMPRGDRDIARFVQKFTVAHTCRWHRERQTIGCGGIYQGRYKSFAVDTDGYVFTVLRYVDQNPIRAGLVTRGEQWPWSSARQHARLPRIDFEIALDDSPIALPPNWLAIVNGLQAESELEAIRTALDRGRPFGSPEWIREKAERLGLEAKLQKRGRPRCPAAGKKGPDLV